MKNFNVVMEWKQGLIKGTLISLGQSINGLEGLGDRTNQDKKRDNIFRDSENVRNIFTRLIKKVPVSVRKEVYNKIGWEE